MVLYKREGKEHWLGPGKERWLGPGKVVFQDGKVVFVRHGGVFVRVSPNRLCKSNTNLGENTEQDNIVLKNSDTIIGKKLKEPTIEQKKSLDIIAETITSAQEDLSHEATAVSHNLNLIKKDNNIQYKLPGSDERISASVLGRAGKATGGNKTWYNVKDHVSEEQNNFHTNDEVDQTDSDIAKQLELEKLNQFNTYEEVEDGGQKTISSRWLITNKNGDTRARLVARGFEEQSFISKYSPTIGKGSIRIFLTFAASKKWTAKITDIKSAFLQGTYVHIKPPVESDTPKGFNWKLEHGLYGLKDGARQFYISVKDELLNLGCRQSKLDPALFILTVKGSVQGVFCCHVDDFLHAGNEEFEKLMEKLKKRFIAGKIEEEDFRYIGFMIKQNNEGIQLDHSIYMKKLDHHT
ncbi:unnamed protein product [Mytilus coruscus]|uniref:Integrase-type domain-containing protein n=1 Tax=Mytilus coruscus TaxID=42192 RepID=A0A6J7ZWW1_MYTCO|nr:unnamed protein product [Mytilus coruscus]